MRPLPPPPAARRRARTARPRATKTLWWRSRARVSGNSTARPDASAIVPRTLPVCLTGKRGRREGGGRWVGQHKHKRHNSETFAPDVPPLIIMALRKAIGRYALGVVYKNLAIKHRVEHLTRQTQKKFSCALQTFEYFHLENCVKKTTATHTTVTKKIQIFLLLLCAVHLDAFKIK